MQVYLFRQLIKCPTDNVCFCNNVIICCGSINHTNSPGKIHAGTLAQEMRVFIIRPCGILVIYIQQVWALNSHVKAFSNKVDSDAIITLLSQGSQDQIDQVSHASLEAFPFLYPHLIISEPSETKLYTVGFNLDANIFVFLIYSLLIYISISETPPLEMQLISMDVVMNRSKHAGGAKHST